MTNKQKARIALARGGSIKGISERYKISVNTLKSWRKGKSPKREVVPQVIPKAPQWMQSISHQNAHLVTHEGRAVCDPERITGIIGMHWKPHDFVKQCTRCMGWESRNVIKGQESSSQKA